MGMISTPNLPKGPVSLAVADGRLQQEAVQTLDKLGIRLLRTGRYPGVCEAISHHPDIMIHHIGAERVVYAPGTDQNLLGSLSKFGFKLIKGGTGLSFKYPGDVAYNVARVGGLYFHNLKYTDPVLKNELERSGAEPVHINQGYAKCSIAVVDEHSIVTSDAGIAKAAEKKGIDTLLINSRQNILLPGMNYGFIGGCSGLVGPGRWAVNGNAAELPSYRDISGFLFKKDIEIISLSGLQVTDIGSLIPLMA